MGFWKKFFSATKKIKPTTPFYKVYPYDAMINYSHHPLVKPSGPMTYSISHPMPQKGIGRHKHINTSPPPPPPTPYDILIAFLPNCKFGYEYATCVFALPTDELEDVIVTVKTQMSGNVFYKWHYADYPGHDFYITFEKQEDYVLFDMIHSSDTVEVIKVFEGMK